MARARLHGVVDPLLEAARTQDRLAAIIARADGALASVRQRRRMAARVRRERMLLWT